MGLESILIMWGLAIVVGYVVGKSKGRERDAVIWSACLSWLGVVISLFLRSRPSYLR